MVHRAFAGPLAIVTLLVSLGAGAQGRPDGSATATAAAWSVTYVHAISIDPGNGRTIGTSPTEVNVTPTGITITIESEHLGPPRTRSHRVSHVSLDAAERREIEGLLPSLHGPGGQYYTGGGVPDEGSDTESVVVRDGPTTATYSLSGGQGPTPPRCANETDSNRSSTSAAARVVNHQPGAQRSARSDAVSWHLRFRVCCLVTERGALNASAFASSCTASALAHLVECDCKRWKRVCRQTKRTFPRHRAPSAPRKPGGAR